MTAISKGVGVKKAKKYCSNLMLSERSKGGGEIRFKNGSLPIICMVPDAICLLLITIASERIFCMHILLVVY